MENETPIEQQTLVINIYYTSQDYMYRYTTHKARDGWKILIIYYLDFIQAPKKCQQRISLGDSFVRCANLKVKKESYFFIVTR